MTTPYRADHVGSLLRPPELLEARAAYTNGDISLEQLREAEDAAVLRALEMQRDAGIDIFSDGEYRRPAWSAAVRESLEGLVPNPDPPIASILGQWQGPHGEVARASVIPGTGLVVGAPVRQVRRFVEADSAFLQKHAPGPWKITMPGAMSAAGTLFKAGVTDQFYGHPLGPRGGGRGDASSRDRGPGCRGRVLHTAGLTALRRTGDGRDCPRPNDRRGRGPRRVPRPAHRV